MRRVNNDQCGHRINRDKDYVAGKILAVLELSFSAIFYVLLWGLEVIPGKYMAALGLGAALLFCICFALQFGNKKSRIVGMVLSIFLCLIFIFGSYNIRQMDQAMRKVGGSNYKTDNMVVVVRKDDKAENLLEAKNYKFGFQLQIDKNNSKLMVEKIEKLLGEEIQLTEYQNLEEMSQALLNKEIDAAIYNEAFNGMLGEKIEGYESKIRVLYQYGIDTELNIEKTDISKAFNIYISGIDVYGPISTNSRSDVNIIMTVNPETKQILLTTTPRDYYVEIPGVSDGQKDKLTHAGIYGVDKSIDTLEQIYGIEINYYARVNFSSLIKIVDILGGIDVYSDYAFTALHGKYKFVEGINHMDGKQALGFSRERYSFNEGDHQRGKNQEAVITAILKKAMSPAILKNANSLIASVSDSVETNMTKDEMAELIRMQLENEESWNIVSVNATGTGDKQSCYSSGKQVLYVMNPDRKSVDRIRVQMNKVIDGEIIK